VRGCGMVVDKTNSSARVEERRKVDQRSDPQQDRMFCRSCLIKESHF
jgi:hypothetical protein